MRKGYVYVDDIYAGIIEETDDGYSFVYDKDYASTAEAKPVSLSMPIKDSPFISQTMFPFFDGLIPEGWLLDIAIKNWKLDPRDRMGLLLSTCKDPIGNVGVFSEKKR